MDEINAFIYGKKIGTLIEHDGLIYFEYDEEFKNFLLEISPIKLNTQKTKKAYTNQDNISLYHGLAGVFFDSLPDKHGMAFINRYFEKQGLKSYEITLLNKLSFIGDRGMGAIEYFPKELEKEEELNLAVNAKDEYEKMKNSLNEETFSIKTLLDISQSVSPVGGGRPKMLVQYNYDTKEIRLNQNKLFENHQRAIIKFDEVYEGVGSIGLTKLEYIFMSMAKEVGIKTCEFKLLEDNTSRHLLVKRFDRTNDDEKIHMCTASALMHTDIKVLKSFSYENLFSLTRIICKSQEEIEELFKRMVLNILCLNFDDHAKNFAYLMNKEGKWTLSPAYDITYSKGALKSHATTLFGKDLNFTRKDILKIAKEQSIKESLAKKILDKCIDVVKSFDQKAIDINLDKENLLECKKNIDEQIKLLE